MFNMEKRYRNKIIIIIIIIIIISVHQGGQSTRNGIQRPLMEPIKSTYDKEIKL